MGFSIPAELQHTLDQVRDFMHREVYPLEKRFLTEPYPQVLPEVNRLRAKVRSLGLNALHMPRDIGGGGLHFTHFARISEELGKSPLGLLVFNSQAPDAGNMELMYLHANAEQRQRFLEPLVRGDVRSCFSMTEPGHAGSNPVVMSVTARRDGDEYVINGTKWFTTGGDGASFAIAMVVTNPDAPPHQRASMIFVPLPHPGVTMRNIPIMGEAGHDFFSHAEVRYENCRVPVSNLLGGEGEGFKLAQDRLGPGRIHHCMRWIGICERALSMLIDRARTRKLSENRLLGDQQTIQEWIAESRADIDAARLLVLNAAEAIETRGAANARVEISCIKFFVPQVMLKVVDRAVQVHGAAGLTDDLLVSWWYRHERGARIYDGPDEVHKMVVARHLLKGAS